MKKFIFPILFFLNIFAFAQNSVSTSENGRFKLSVKNAPEGSVRVFEVTRNSETIGNIKSTTVELMFENQTNKILEGDFEFALEEGESVVGYSLDINGKMRKGVVVEKEKARTVFESEVRKGVDPGIIEKTVGNNFKTRVYPIPAHGVRKIEVVFEKELSFDSKDEKSIETGKIYTQTIGTDTYFYFFEKVQNKETYYDKTPVSLTAFFDVSDSAKNRDLNKEIELLKTYTKNRGIKNIEIVTFANSILQSAKIENTEKNFSEIETLLKKQVFDGATNLNLDFGRLATNSAEIIIFSDGISNWGSENLIKLQKSARLITVNSSASANFSVLKKIARENNGVFINLRELSVSKASEKILEVPVRIQKIEFDGNAISDVYPIVGSEISKGFSVAGILKKKNGTLKITIGNKISGEKTIEKNISAIGSTESEKIARLWAMKKIEFLSDDKDSNKAQIIDVAKKFSVVTDETSLIVLDTVYQYVQHGIVPPEELREEYERIAGRRTGKSASDVTNIFGGVPRIVHQNFENFRNWWKKTPKDFEKEANRLNNKKNIRSNGIRFESAAADDEVPVYSDMPTASARASESLDEFVFDDEESIGFAASEEEISSDWVGTGFNPEGPASLDGQNPPVYSDMSNVVGSKAMAKSASRAAAEPVMMKDAQSQSESNQSENKIALKSWSSNAPYLSILKKTETEKMYEKYLELKAEYGTSPAFYIEVSDYFMEEKLIDESMRILSNLAELNLENSDVLRALANKLVERSAYELAIPVFERLTKIRAEIPQFYRDLALCYNAIGETSKAVENLWKIASKNWDNRFNEIQQIALNDMNSMIEISRLNGKLKQDEIDKINIEGKFLQNFDMDMRVVLTWNTDDCDVDLWVTDPNGEKCYYGHKNTVIGGRMSRDFTQGYGPEEFCIRNAKKGSYKIEANYYGNHQQKLLQPVIVQAEVYTNFGRKNQQKKVLTLQLSDIKGTFEIGSCDWE